MGHFDKVAAALEYIDGHLEGRLDYRQIAELFHFSPFYFHRLFTAVVGKPMSAYIRDRRLLRACRLLSETGDSILDICIGCGFDSPQSFNRAFKNSYGVTPGDYRRLGYTPAGATVRELIVSFTNRLKGGILVTPRVINKEPLRIAGTAGDGNSTAALWQRFLSLNESVRLDNKLSDNGYEVRIFSGGSCVCHVGVPVGDGALPEAYSLLRLPAALYAAFDVYVARGYDSENTAMTEWLEANRDTYAQKLLDGAPYVVEFYDERFKGDSGDSIVEIWVPIEEKLKCD